MYMYKKDLASNNLQWLIWHATQPNPKSYQQNVFTNPIYIYIYIYIYTEDSALNNQQVYICHSIQISKQRFFCQG